MLYMMIDVEWKEKWHWICFCITLFRHPGSLLEARRDPTAWSLSCAHSHCLQPWSEPVQQHTHKPRIQDSHLLSLASAVVSVVV